MAPLKGFTLLELLVFLSVFTVLVFLTFTKLSMLTKEANESATIAVASSLTASNARNYYQRLAISKKIGYSIRNCTDVVKLLSGGLPPDYSVDSTPVSPNITIPCTLYGPGTTAIFTATGVS